MIERLARLGYLSIGLVYMIVGGFAISAGLGRRGSAGGQQTAFAFISHQPFGRAALAVMATGLIGYSLWRILSAITDSEHRGSDAKGLALRAGSLFRGLGYGAITIEVLRIIQRGHGSGDQKTKHWTAAIMDQPFGRWIVALTGIGIIVYGAYQLYRAWDAKLSKHIHLGDLDARVRRNVIAVSRLGIGARGIVFFVIGGSLVRAAMKHNPSAARSTSEALQIFPDPLLVPIGIGLAAYGVYALVNARYRSIRT